MKNTTRIYTTVTAALYTMLFFNGFYYLTLGNMGVFIEVLPDVLLKGFIIGLTGRFIFEKVNLEGFLPYGIIGSVLGLFAVDFLMSISSPFGSFFVMGQEYVIKLAVGFTLTVTFGALSPDVARKISEFFFYKKQYVGGEE